MKHFLFFLLCVGLGESIWAQKLSQVKHLAIGWMALQEHGSHPMHLEANNLMSAPFQVVGICWT